MVRTLQWTGPAKQAFAVKLFPGIWHAHPRWFNRTVLVKDNKVEEALNLLARLMRVEGLTKIIMSTRRFQKPHMQRRNMAMDASKAIYSEDMTRKINFIARKNRPDAYPGQMTT